MEARVSLERRAVDAILADLPTAGLQVFRGQSLGNRIDPPGWDLSTLQRFQFGDLRIESPSVRVIIELESAGGLTSLVKYWPLLAAGWPDRRRFRLVHVFGLTSAGDYLAHRKLWEFTCDRMRADLVLQRRL